MTGWLFVWFFKKKKKVLLFFALIKFPSLGLIFHTFFHKCFKGILSSFIYSPSCSLNSYGFLSSVKVVLLALFHALNEDQSIQAWKGTKKHNKSIIKVVHVSYSLFSMHSHYICSQGVCVSNKPKILHSTFIVIAWKRGNRTLFNNVPFGFCKWQSHVRHENE